MVWPLEVLIQYGFAGLVAGWALGEIRARRIHDQEIAEQRLELERQRVAREERQDSRREDELHIERVKAKALARIADHVTDNGLELENDLGP